jgi:hypothetical protein
VIERDRELLAWLAQINQHLGEVVLDLMADQDGGELPATGVRDLGQRFVEFGTDLLARATELDGSTIGPVIIDGQPC